VRARPVVVADVALRSKPGRVTQRRGPSAITAAGRRIDLASERDIKGVSTRPYPWQKRAYNFYDPMSNTALGEVWFAGRYVAESLSRCRLLPAVQLDAGDDPMPLTDQNLESMSPTERPTDETVMLLRAATERLTNSHGGQADILRGASLNNFLAGESWLVGRAGEDTEEEWEIHSVEAIEVVEPAYGGKEAVLGLKILPEDAKEQWEPLDKATIVRLWRRHPRYPELPDAAMGAALTYCEDLWALTQMIRAAARSRMNSGILKYPSTQASPTPEEDADDDSGEPARDEFLEKLIRHFSTPIQEPNDASALVPFILRMDPEDIEKVSRLDFAREIDRLAVELRHESREAFAATIDLPSDVLTGKQGLNDWSAWNVDEETFRVHLAPHAELICDALTSGYFWPTLVGIDDYRRYRLWYDASNLVVHPDKTNQAGEAHDRMVISDASYRDATGWTEADAPDEEEVARRIEIDRARREQTGSPMPADLPAPESPGGPESGPPTPQGPSEAAQGVAASAAPQPRDVRDSLGFRLAQIEHALMERLLTAADGDLRRALARAGSRVASAARSRTTPEQVRRIVSAPPAEEVCAYLGPTLLASLSLTTDAVLDGAFDALYSRWDAWVRRAQDEAIRLIDTRGNGLSADTQAKMRAANAVQRDAGWVALRDALVATTTKVLFAEEEPTALGERDPSILVPPRALRRALAIAGGAHAMANTVVAAAGDIAEALRTAEQTGATTTIEVAATEPPVQGLFSGDEVREALAESGIATTGYVWVYGDPSSRGSSFDAHWELDGTEFQGWDDDVLINDGGWPETDYFYPDDHDGCQCTYAILDAPPEVSGASDEEAVDDTEFRATFDSGGTYPDAETFVANEPRFELVREHDSMTAAGEYRDTETGTHFMLKNTTEGYDMEAAHEVEARLLLDDTSMLHMDALAASDLDINGNGAVIARWADQDPAVDRVLGIGLTPESEGSLSAAEDAVRFQTFDSAVNNTDRHDFNYLSVVDRQGDTRFYAIDHSLIDPSGMYAEDQEEWGERFARVFAHDPEEFSTRLSEQDAIALSQRFGQEVLDNLPRLEAYANDLEANGAVYTAGQVREDIGFIGARLRALVEGDESWYEAEPF